MRGAPDHSLSTFSRKAIISILILVLVLVVGTEVMHETEGWSYLDSLFFISFLATTQGPTAVPKTEAGKIFAIIMSFLSVGAVISSVVFVFGPVAGSVFKVGMDHLGRKKERTRSEAKQKE